MLQIECFESMKSKKYHAYLNFIECHETTSTKVECIAKYSIFRQFDKLKFVMLVNLCLCQLLI